MDLLPIAAGLGALIVAAVVLLFVVYRPASAEISRERRSRLAAGAGFSEADRKSVV